MPRTMTIEKTVFTYDELSDSAKETARERWNRFYWESGQGQEDMELIFDGYMEELGWENAEDLSYSLFMRGGEPTFQADIPEFQHDGVSYYVTVRKRHVGGGSYYMTTEVDLEDTFEDLEYDSADWHAAVEHQRSIERAASEHLRDVQAELSRRMYAEDEYQSSDEVVAELSEANGYEYDEDGELA